MPSKDPEVNKRARDRWYYGNREKQIARQKERRKGLNEQLTAYKRSLCCSVCGFSFSEYPTCCDFHHLKDKINTVRIMVRSSSQKMQEELEKCIPVCANCHRILHEKGGLGS